MALLLPLLNPLRSLLVTVAVMTAVLAGNLVVFHYGNLVLPLASGLVMISLLFALNMSYGYFVESRGKRQITGLVRPVRAAGTGRRNGQESRELLDGGRVA